MTIQILGNGGFINMGIPYNALFIDNDFLIEAPPDIMQSLRRSDIPYYRIRRIYISHFHGDHYFGMPFLTLNLLNYYLETNKGIEPIEVIGPHHLREHLIEIQGIAASPQNPSVEFIDKVFTFSEIDLSSRVRLDQSVEMIFHKMNHSKETYGFSLIKESKYRLTYLIDTKWHDSFADILSHKPEYVFCDLNSQSDDKIKEHMCENDIVEKALPLTGTATKYIGIHLSGLPASDLANLHYSRVGEKYELGGI